MNIALVTNKDLHHKYWIRQLYKKNKSKIKLIIIPKGKKKTIFEKISDKKIFYYGLFYLFLKLLSLFYNMFSFSVFSGSIRKAEKKYFINESKKFKEIPENLIRYVETVNCDESIKLIKKHKIHSIFFLGGDIAKNDFIKSASVCLNYHSGLSPFYNGNKTIFHSVSDFRPNFAGGTLMKMNERIDGGEILMHFLPEINNEDNAADLFMKGIIGSVKLFQHYIDNYDHEIKGIKQKKSFRYLRNIDWNITNDLRLLSFYKKDRMKIYSRDSEIISYINKGYDLSKMYSIVLTKILK
tara:strand:- start:10126 stop:11013 length:888 start_codon:yes stop_codon:yes gene_type:complete